jgi:serine/threonine-protein kinase RsbT
MLASMRVAEPPNSMTNVEVLTHLQGSLPLANHLDVVLCRQRVRLVTQAVKFGVTPQTMLVTAASELARNTIIHGGGGTFRWEVIAANGRHGVRLYFEDQGPGIANIGQAMANGWTSGKGLGLGLPGTKRLVNEFDIQSTLGSGTRVTITRWR